MSKQRPREAEFLTLSHAASRSCDRDQIPGRSGLRSSNHAPSPTYYGQPNPPTHRPERADHWQAAASTDVRGLGRLGNGGTPPLGEPALFAGLHPRYSASLPKALALDRRRLCSQMQPPPPHPPPPPAPATAPAAASAHSHPALPPRGLSISQNCGVSRGQAFPPGVRTMPRRDLWDSLTSQCPGSLRGVTAGTHGRVWGASSQDPGAPRLALLPRIASAPPLGLGVLVEGWEAAPRVFQPCFLPQPRLGLLNQSPESPSSQFLPI